MYIRRLAPILSAKDRCRFICLHYLNITVVLEHYLNILNHDFTVIELSETWLNDNDSDLYGLLWLQSRRPS